MLATEDAKTWEEMEVSLTVLLHTVVVWYLIVVALKWDISRVAPCCSLEASVGARGSSATALLLKSCLPVFLKYIFHINRIY